MTSALPPLVQACSGALGSAAANALSYPLDLVSTKLQTTSSRKWKGIPGAVRLLRYILRVEGLAGLYDGAWSDTASTIVSNFLYFYFYALLHAIAARTQRSSKTPLLQALKHALSSTTRPVLLDMPTELAIGFVAGVASRAVSTPLNVVTVRLQTSNDEEDDTSEESTVLTSDIKRPDERTSRNRPRTFWDIARNIYAQDGLAGFWAGFRPTLPLCLTPALTLLLFQVLSRLRLSHKTAHSAQSSLGTFLSGASANALAVTVLYPLLLAKVRVQAARSSGAETPAASTMTDVWASALRAEGWPGLYQALGAQIMKGFVNQGVTMLVKHRIERAVVRLYTRS